MSYMDLSDELWDDDEAPAPEIRVPEGWTFVRTCYACPEQYELLTEDNLFVGYFRLRHGSYSVRAAQSRDADPVWGQEVYGKAIGGPWRGEFETTEQRVEELQAGVDAVVQYWTEETSE
jgi:hypothetical protein